MLSNKCKQGSKNKRKSSSNSFNWQEADKLDRWARGYADDEDDEEDYAGKMTRGQKRTARLVRFQIQTAHLRTVQQVTEQPAAVDNKPTQSAAVKPEAVPTAKVLWSTVVSGAAKPSAASTVKYVQSSAVIGEKEAAKRKAEQSAFNGRGDTRAAPPAPKGQWAAAATHTHNRSAVVTRENERRAASTRKAERAPTATHYDARSIVIGRNVQRQRAFAHTHRSKVTDMVEPRRREAQRVDASTRKPQQGVMTTRKPEHFVATAHKAWSAVVSGEPKRAATRRDVSPAGVRRETCTKQAAVEMMQVNNQPAEESPRPLESTGITCTKQAAEEMMQVNNQPAEESPRPLESTGITCTKQAAVEMMQVNNQPAEESPRPLLEPPQTLSVESDIIEEEHKKTREDFKKDKPWAYHYSDDDSESSEIDCLDLSDDESDNGEIEQRPTGSSLGQMPESYAQEDMAADIMWDFSLFEDELPTGSTQEQSSYNKKRSRSYLKFDTAWADYDSEDDRRMWAEDPLTLFDSESEEDEEPVHPPTGASLNQTLQVSDVQAEVVIERVINQSGALEQLMAEKAKVKDMLMAFQKENEALQKKVMQQREVLLMQQNVNCEAASQMEDRIKELQSQGSQQEKVTADVLSQAVKSQDTLKQEVENLQEIENSVAEEDCKIAEIKVALSVVEDAVLSQRLQMEEEKADLLQDIKQKQQVLDEEAKQCNFQTSNVWTDPATVSEDVPAAGEQGRTPEGSIDQLNLPQISSITLHEMNLKQLVEEKAEVMDMVTACQKENKALQVKVMQQREVLQKQQKCNSEALSQEEEDRVKELQSQVSDQETLTVDILFKAVRLQATLQLEAENLQEFVNSLREEVYKTKTMKLSLSLR